MLLILLSWIYILFTTVNLGIVTQKVLKIRAVHITITSLIGLFATTLFAGFWAIFGRINIEFHIVLLVLNCLLFYWHKIEFMNTHRHFIDDFRRMSFSLQIMVLALTLLVLAQCASAPYAVDNESYYIQTIKWINEYGFVNGLANLHIFFGQTSGWHIAQSAFSFSFLYDRFNDLSGYCLLLGNVFALFQLDQYFKNGDKSSIIIGFFPIANVLLFQFVGAPSPDIPIYILTLMIVSFYLQNSSDHFKTISILVLFALFIKTTSLALMAFPLLLLMQNLRSLLAKSRGIVFLAIAVGVLFVVKNYIISGYLLFPMPVTARLLPDWQVPTDIVSFYYTETKLFAYRLNETQYDAMSAVALFKHWLLLPKLHGLFNILSILLIIICPVLIKKYFNESKYWFLYTVMCLQMLLLFASSPQYRFFLNFLLIFSFLCISCFVTNRKWIAAGLLIFTAITAATLVVPMNLSALTKNDFAKTNSVFSGDYLVTPHPNSKLRSEYQSITTWNLKYNSPIHNDFFWGSGDGPLPAINKVQLDYFYNRFGVVPQLRGEELSQGFYAKAQ